MVACARRVFLATLFASGLWACGGTGTTSTGGAATAGNTSGSGSGSSTGAAGSTGGLASSTSTTTTSGGSGSTGSSTGGNLCDSQACLVYAETANDLYEVDPANPGGGAQHICAFGGDASGVAINDIAVDTAGTLYALSSSSLYRVNLSVQSGKCAATLVTDVAGSVNYNALSFTIDGQLLAAGSDGTIARIDLAQGTSTVVGQFANGYGSSGDFVAISDGRIFATARSSSSDDTLVQIGLDSSSGQYTQQAVIGPVGYQGVYGLGFWAGVLYGFDSDGDVLQIDPATAHATLLGNTGRTWYGAGTTPKAPIFQ